MCIQNLMIINEQDILSLNQGHEYTDYVFKIY